MQSSVESLMSTTLSHHTLPWAHQYNPMPDWKITKYVSTQVKPKSLALDITKTYLELDKNAQVRAPDAPGLGMNINVEGLTHYLVDVSIEVNGRNLYQTPKL